MRIESLFFPGQSHLNPDGVTWYEFDGEVDITLLVAEDDGSPGPHYGYEVCSDTVRLVAAPFLMLPHTQSASEVWMVGDDVETPPPGADPGDALAPAFDPLDRRGGFVGNLWYQDHVEFGYTRMPGSQMHVALRMPYTNAQPEWPVIAPTGFLGPGRGCFRFRNTTIYDLPPPLYGPFDWNGEFGGNLEICPPSMDWAHGRIVYGSTMFPMVPTFLDEQDTPSGDLQKPVALYNGWLRIGHIDEMIGYVPGGPRGYKVTVASPAYALKLLQDGDLDREIPPPPDHAPLFSTGGFVAGTASNSINLPVNNYLFDGVAHGYIQCPGANAITDGATITIADGLLGGGHTRTFEFDKNGAWNPNNVHVIIMQAYGPLLVRTALLEAIQLQSTLQVDEQANGADGILLINKNFGTAGNVTITQSPPGHLPNVQGMAGGEAAGSGTDFTSLNYRWLRIYSGPGAGNTADAAGVAVSKGKGWIRVAAVFKLPTVVTGLSADVNWWNVAVLHSPPAQHVKIQGGWFFRPDATGRFVFVNDCKMWVAVLWGSSPPALINVPALITAYELRNDAGLIALNESLRGLISAEKSVLQSAMGGDGVGGYFLRSEPDEPWDDSLTGDSNDDFINVPVLYFGEAPSDRSVGAFIPNLVNGQPVSGSEFVLPKPYGPRSVSGATDCLFETAISLLLPPATFVDDWESYHREEGEVHCGTAAVREIPPTPWWSVNP